MNYLIIILLLGLLILIHEFGHFIFARFFNIPVARFSIGFGPKVWGIKKNSTDYWLSLIPFGGYILPDIKDEKEFYHISVFRRIVFTLGGPAANILVSILVLALLNLIKFGFSMNGFFIESILQTYSFLIKITYSIPYIFTRPEQLSGIVGIVAQGGQFVGYNIENALHLFALLSLNLAVFNMLPFPALDGGKIILYSLEKIHPKLLKLHMPLTIAGWVFILGFMVYITINDVVKLFA